MGVRPERKCLQGPSSPQDTARALPALPPHFVAPKQIGDWKSLDKPISLEKNFD